MAYNGSGVFVLVAGNPVVTGTTISSTWANNTLNDIATGLSTAVTKDGQSTPTNNIPMGGFKLTGLGAGTAAGNSLRWEQLFSQGAVVTVASAATTDIGVQTSVAVEITGTTTITSFGTNYNGPRYLRFTGALLLTQSATLNLPGGANITTVAGDTAIAYPNAAANGWNVVSYTPGTPAVKLVQSTRDISLASGTQTITGAGFTPRSVSCVYAYVDGTGRGSINGASDGANHSCLGNLTNVTPGTWAFSGNRVIYITNGAGAIAEATIAFNSDGGVLTWTKTGAPTGTANLSFLFQR